MRKKLDDIEIVEPPLGELTKKKSGLLRTCLSGCGCLMLVLITLFIALKLFVGPGPKTLRTVPEGFPATIPVYDRDAIERITFIPSRYKNRGLQVASFFPKIIFAPLFVPPAEGPASATTTATRASTWVQKVVAIKNFWSLLSTPVGETGDTIKIEWRNITAEPKFVFYYYKKELEKSGYTIADQVTTKNGYQCNFSSKTGTTGSLELRADENTTAGTNYAILIVNVPHVTQ